jgi:hypothetical protein
MGTDETRMRQTRNKSQMTMPTEWIQRQVAKNAKAAERTVANFLLCALRDLRALACPSIDVDFRKSPALFVLLFRPCSIRVSSVAPVFANARR